MLAWRIYYGDGGTYSSADGDPADAPARGVQAIVQADTQVGRHVLSGFDYYWWEGTWFGGDLFGLFDYLIEPGPKAVKFGRTVPNDVFERVIRAACDDPDFPRKSARRRHER